MRKLTLKGQIKKNWDLCRKIIRVLRGNSCEICQSIYELQVDHCFSRNVKELFYEIANLTLLCGSCHTKKSFNMEDVALQVFEHVENREGAKFYEMRRIAKKKGSFRDWQLMAYHEEQNARLTGILNNLTSNLTKG